MNKDEAYDVFDKIKEDLENESSFETLNFSNNLKKKRLDARILEVDFDEDADFYAFIAPNGWEKKDESNDQFQFGFGMAIRENEAQKTSALEKLNEYESIAKFELKKSDPVIWKETKNEPEHKFIVYTQILEDKKKCVENFKSLLHILIAFKELNAAVFKFDDDARANEEYGIATQHLSLEELQKKIKELDSIPSKKETVSNKFERSSCIRLYAKKRSNGKCELCGENGFETEQGDFYIEVHHIDALGDGGSDSIENTIALCPTCHRKAHHSKDKENIKLKLKEIAKNRK